MSAIGVVAGIGALATLFSLLALRDAHRLKGDSPRSHRVVVAFWVSVVAYMLMFTLLRAAHVVGIPWTAGLFYAQTIAGASTIMALSWIMIGIAAGHQWGRLGAEIGGAACVMVLTLVFAFGLTGPRVDFWSIEYLPASRLARILIGIVYVAAPVFMSSLVVRVMRGFPDRILRRRSYFFSAAVVLMYVPNAGKYVTFVTGTTSVAMAIIMMVGTYIGWRAYKLPDNA